MAFKIRYSEQSSDDLADIIRYISDELFNPQAAERFFKGVEEKIGLLRSNPYLFPLYHDEKLNAIGCRSVTIGNYLMFYVVDDVNSIVNIVRIIYSRRNISAIFEK